MNCKRLVILVAISVITCHFFMTGSPFPMIKMETLNSPQEVCVINGTDLYTRSGEFVSIPFVTKLPDSEIVKNICRKGIEIRSDGQLFGLLKIRHWCGNDPYFFGYDRRKVNFSSICIFVDPSCVSTNIHEMVELVLNESQNHSIRYQTQKELDAGDYLKFKRLDEKLRELQSK